jgi:hypothetical protein
MISVRTRPENTNGRAMTKGTPITWSAPLGGNGSGVFLWWIRPGLAMIKDAEGAMGMIGERFIQVTL